MTKRDLLLQLLSHADNLDEEIQVAILEKDEETGISKTYQYVPILRWSNLRDAIIVLESDVKMSVKEPA